MPWDLIGTAVTSLLGLLGLWLGRARRSHLRDEVEQDQRILANLADGSDLREVLQESIDARVRQIAGAVDKATTPRREPFAIGLGIFFLVLAAAFGLRAVEGGWWIVLWLPVAFFGLFGLIGLIEGGRKVHRDEKGAEIKVVEPST